MPTTSGAQIGGALDDMHSVISRLAEAGAGATSHAAEARIGVEHLRNEVNDVTVALTSTFVQLADNLREQIARAHDTLVAADWSGRSRGAADAAEARLNSDVNATMESAQAGVEALGNVLRQQVESFYEDVNGQFSTVMGNIESAYGELSRGTQMFAENLTQADQAISFGGS